MASSSRSTRRADKLKCSETSPEWINVSREPPNHKLNKVHVFYVISRNGLLEQTHFIEVPLSSPDGLYLRDVIRHLVCLRGNDMTSMYSWAVKRTYLNQIVWQDLVEHDFIYPSPGGQEYFLKGSELPLPPPPPAYSTSSETLETLLRADSSKCKRGASSFVKQLLGSVSFKGCGPSYRKGSG